MLHVCGIWVHQKLLGGGIMGSVKVVVGYQGLGSLLQVCAGDFYKFPVMCCNLDSKIL